MRQVAALYVDTARGPYCAMPGVEVWDAARDARAYPGPSPVVAHPPCGHWGLLRWNCKQPESWRTCGPIAVAQVKAYGGVLEHPANSLLWKECGLPTPDPHLASDWTQPDSFTIEVDQCRWGHRARKRTWIYCVGVDRALLELPPWREPTHVMGVSLHKGRTKPCLPKKERHLTPPAFAEWLVNLARSAR